MDSNDDLICPLCGKIMKKIYFKNIAANIDVCLDGCGGIFFDGRELKKISVNDEDLKVLLDLIKDKTFEKVDTKKQLKCPTCKALMVNHYTTPSKRNEIDECYTCGGIFVKSEIFVKILEEMNLPPEKKESMAKYLSSYMTPEISAALQKEKANIDNIFKQ